MIERDGYRYLTVIEAAAESGRARSRIEAWISEGLRTYRILNDRRRFVRDDELQAALLHHMHRSSHVRAILDAQQRDTRKVVDSPGHST